MKKKSFFYFFVSIAICLSGCSSDDKELLDSTKNVRNSDPRYVSLSEAIEIANEYISQIEESSTKATTRIVSTVELLNGGKTRSNTEESDYNDYYLINYSNNQGFAIVSSDKYKTPVYAFSDEGSLSWADTTYNEGFRQYVRGLNDTNNFIIPDSLINPPNPGDVSDYKVKIYNRVPPFIRLVLTYLGQRAPFNMYCPLDSLGNHFPTGCGPIALALVFSVYSKPDTICGDSIDWKEIISIAESPQIARFLADIGKPGYLNVTYEISGSGNPVSNLKKTLSSLNYSYNHISTYEESGVLKSLSNAMPVIIIGGRKITNDLTSYHTWVTDGYLETETIYFPNSMNPSYVYKNYLHMIWGYNGHGNGFFLYDNGFGGIPSYLDVGEDNNYSVPVINQGIFTINVIKYNK